MSVLAQWGEAAIISAEVAMTLGDLDTAETRLKEARIFIRGAAERGEEYISVAQELGITEARLFVARHNRRFRS